MFKEDPMPRCPYCDDVLCYCVFDMHKRIARFRCPTCNSEFPSSQKHKSHCKIRKPDKIRCEMYEAGNWETRLKKRSDNNV